MNSRTGTGPAFRPGAVGAGMLWGLAVLLVGALINSVGSSLGAIPPALAETVMPLVWQGVGALVGGYVAGKRAASIGWLHGALAGMAFVLSLAAIMGVGFALPALADLLKVAGVGLGAATVGGMLGVGASGR